MHQQEVKEIIACLPRGKTEFLYAKGQYAVDIMTQYLRQDQSIAHLKQSRYAALLNQPAFKTALAAAGNGILTQQMLSKANLPKPLPFILTLASWGGIDNGYQTSRRGYNLVLQLNFAREHDMMYRDLVKPREDALFNYKGHPIMRKAQREFFCETLAWSRIDIDFDQNSALIEEIQSDWVRLAREAQLARTKTRHKQAGRYWAKHMAGSRQALTQYVKEVLLPYEKIWAEAMLMATISLIQRELGIRTIYYHGFESGIALKDTGTFPPRSLYTVLPKRFCFEQTAYGPAFLMDAPEIRKKYRSATHGHWYRLTH